MNARRCRSCGAAVIMARTAKGNVMPLDREPNTEKANVLLGDDGVARSYRDAQAASLAREEADEGSPLWAADRHTSHHFTCPDGAAWRSTPAKPKAAKAERPSEPEQEAMPF